MDRERIKEFKAKLIMADKTIKQFAEEHDFNRVIFVQAINGHVNLRKEFIEAIEAFMKE